MNKRWNIIIVTLFITLIVWIIWLVITKYLLNLVEVSSENHKYYKAYYAAYAGIEIELWKLKNHGMWFSDKIDKNSQTVSKNITGSNYYFSSSISSTWNNITSNPKSLLTSSIDCSDDKNHINIWTWEALMLPLIYDKNNWEWQYSWLNYNSLSIYSNNFNIYHDWDVIISFQSKNEKINKNYNVSWIKNLSNIFPSINFVNLAASNQPFLVFAWKEESSICIESPNNFLVSPYSYVQSKWSFIDRTVQLKVIKKHEWANFSIYGIY